MAKILIVDDSQTYALSHKEMLKGEGHEFVMAGDGEEGLSMAKAEKPDLILMDLVMPGMNGFQATRKLSKDPETENIPVIVTSSKDGETDVIYAQRQGAVDYLIKPIEKDDLIAAVNKVLG